MKEHNKRGINVAFCLESLKGRDRVTHLGIAGVGNITIWCEAVDLGHGAVEGFCESANFQQNVVNFLTS
jgi:hypothetical protein